MPFYDGNLYHFFYLLDEGHHQGLEGLGGHQWAHASSSDLIHWEQHPIALPITDDSEGSICTGSVFFHDDAYYAFYATRKRDWTQHLSYAKSKDCLHFEKQLPNPFITVPEGYTAADFRDPFVFKDSNGRFQMLITSRVDNFHLHERGGCILRLSSDDFENWQSEGTEAITGGDAGEACAPECPDWFEINGWYYLLYGPDHKTCYLMSRNELGPWVRPSLDTLGNSWMLSVMKTAPFKNNRRIGAGWIGERKDHKDDREMLWGGTAVFREIVQLADGTLGTRFPEEMVPATKSQLTDLTLECLTSGASGNPGQLTLKQEALQAEEVASIPNLPLNYRLRCKAVVKTPSYCFGLGLRGAGKYESMYKLGFQTRTRQVSLEQETVELPEDTDTFELDVIVKDSIIDICINNHTCIINRLYELQGTQLFFFCEGGAVDFKNIEISPLK